jgi:hypothetical protein
MNGWKQYVTWVLMLMFGGFGGSLLTFFLVNRSTTIEYTINRTALGTNETAVIPDFKVGDTNLKSLYIYSIRFDYRSGPELENAKVGIDFANQNVRSVGKIVPESTSQVFPITCDQFKDTGKSLGTICSFGRFNSNVGTYTVSFATDTSTEINLSLDAKNTQLKRAGVADAGTGYSTVVAFCLTCIVLALTPLVYYQYKITKTFDVLHFASSAQVDSKKALASTPILDVDYEGTPANKTEAHYTRDGVKVDEIYIRVRVRNLGTGTAKGVRVFLTDLHEVHNGVTTPTSLVWDSLQLAWAGWKFDAQDVPEAVSFYADVMRVSKQNSGWLLSVQKVRLANDADLDHYSGTLRFQITVTADNAPPTTCEIHVTYNKDWHSLRAVQVEKGESNSTS